MKTSCWKASIVVLLAGCVVACAGYSQLAYSQGAVDIHGAQTHVEAAFSACSSLSWQEKRNCYERILLERLEVGGVADALAMLEAIAVLDRDVQSDGHVYTHAIGIEAYRLNNDVAAVFSECSLIFQSGCYHGVIQAHFTSKEKLDAADINALCEPYKADGRDLWKFFQCLHGMGHGLTMFYGHHLPRALADCDQLSRDWDRDACYGGAFMENIMNATAPHHPATKLAVNKAGGAHEHAAEQSGGHEHGMAHGEDQGTEAAAPYKALDPDNPLYPCNTLEERYLRACYSMQTSAMLWFNGWDVAAAARSCDSIRQEAMRPVCYQSLGRDISAYTLQDPAESIQLCSLGSAQYQPWCYQGLVKNFIDLNKQTDSAFAFCRKVEGSGNKMKCYEAIGEELGVLKGTEAERVEVCRQAEGVRYEQACLYGTRAIIIKPAGL